MKNTLFFKTVLLFVLIMLSIKVVTAQIIDENNGFNGNYVADIGHSGSNFYAQSFYANENVITKFGVIIREDASEGEVILSIAADNGVGAPNVSAPLYQGTLRNPSTTGTWFYETGINVPVTIGQKYWVLINGYNNQGATGMSEIGLSGTFTDTGEGMIFSNTGGSTWSSLPTTRLAIYVEGSNAQIIDENNGYNGDYVYTVGETGSDFYAQSFLANENVITKFGVIIRENASEGEVILSIAADNGAGAPNVSAPLYQGTLRNPSTTGTWFYETGINVPVTIGQKYWVLIDGYNNAGATGKSGIGQSDTYTDTGEGMIYSNSAGVGSWGSLPDEPLAIYVEGSITQIIDENNGFNGNNIFYVGETGTDFYAQSFYANIGMITKFCVVITEIDSEGELILAIASDNAGVPNFSSPLYHGTLRNPTNNTGWFCETGFNVPVTFGEKYYILIDGYNNPGATGSSQIGLSNTHTDTGEGMIFSNFAGVGSWSSIPQSIAVYVEGTYANLTFSDTTVVASTSACFSATNTVIVGGDATAVDFLDGSSVNLIAKNSIRLMPGVHAYEGSTVHAYITVTDEFCSTPSIRSLAYNNPYKSAAFNSTVPAIENQNEKQSVKIFPNPNKGIFTVEMNHFENPATITISNLNGKILFQTNCPNVENNQFNLSHFKPGVYFVQVNDGRSLVTQKILIQ